MYFYFGRFLHPLYFIFAHSDFRLQKRSTNKMMLTYGGKVHSIFLVDLYDIWQSLEILLKTQLVHM